MPISKELLAILVCPECKGPLALVADGNGLHCAACHLVYPIRDNIPVMIKDEAFKEEAFNSKDQRDSGAAAK